MSSTMRLTILSSSTPRRRSRKAPRLSTSRITWRNPRLSIKDLSSSRRLHKRQNQERRYVGLRAFGRECTTWPGFCLAHRRWSTKPGRRACYWGCRLSPQTEHLDCPCNCAFPPRVTLMSHFHYNSFQWLNPKSQRPQYLLDRDPPNADFQDLWKLGFATKARYLST